MTLTPFLLLPLVGGYALFSTWRRTHYYSAREDGHRLYFRAVFYGTFLTIFSALTHILFFVHANWYQAIVRIVAECLGVPEETSMWQQPAQAIVLLSTVFWGPALGEIFNLPSRLEQANWVPPKFRYLFGKWARRVLEGAYRLKGSDLERLVLKSQDTSLPIMVTLQNGKIYVGWPIENISPGEDRKTLRLSPLLSGYRDDTHQVQFTTDYSVALAKRRDELLELNQQSSSLSNAENYATTDEPELRLSRKNVSILPDDLFEVILKADQIISSRLFDFEVYGHFKLQGKS